MMDYKHASDNELLQHCRKDDVKAYNELVDRYLPRLGRLTQSIVKDSFTAEEMIMDLLFNLWERRHVLEIRGSVSAYLFQAFKYMTIRHLRKSLPQTAGLSSLEEQESPVDMEADYLLRSKEAEADFQKKLIKLSPQPRRVFELSRKENLTYAEIAQRMNLSVKTVESYMVAALAHMRDQYSNHPEFLILLIASSTPALLS